MKDLISVIVPVYKTENYLCKCVDSILAQTYTNLEIILVDDGSPDNCGKICDEYAAKDSRVKVIHQKNGGLSAARNAGLDIATGEYIGFVDSDDYIAPDMYEKLYNALVSNEADMSICNHQKVGIKLFFDDNEMPLLTEVISEQDAMRKQYECLNCSIVVAWSKLYKRVIWNDLRFPSGKIHEDEFVSFDVFYKCKRIAIISDKLYCYYIRADGIIGKENGSIHPDYFDALYLRSELIQKNKYENLYRTFWYGFSWSFRQYIRFSSYYKRSSKERKKHIFNIAKEVYKTYQPYANRNEHFIFNHPNLYIIISKIKRKLVELKKNLSFKLSQTGKDFVLINLPVYGNYGDQAIALSEIQFFKKLNARFAVLNEDVTDTVGDKIYKCIGKDKTVVICGGGFMGGLWTEAEKKYIQQPIKALPDNRIIIFPQTVTFDPDSEYGKQFFENEKNVYSSHKNLTVFVREQKSFGFMKQYMPEVNTLFAPDMVLGLDLPFGGLERNGVLFCMRNDREKAVDSIDTLKNAVLQKYPDMEQTFVENSVCKLIEPENREKETFEQIKKFASSKLVVTDRLHGMAFAAITSTPCIAFNNSNGKIAGVYEWIKENCFIKLCNSAEEAIRVFDDLNLNTEYHFDKAKCDSAFLPLIEALNGKNGT